MIFSVLYLHAWLGVDCNVIMATKRGLTLLFVIGLVSLFFALNDHLSVPLHVDRALIVPFPEKDGFYLASVFSVVVPGGCEPLLVRDGDYDVWLCQMPFEQSVYHVHVVHRDCPAANQNETFYRAIASLPSLLDDGRVGDASFMTRLFGPVVLFNQTMYIEPCHYGVRFWVPVTGNYTLHILQTGADFARSTEDNSRYHNFTGVLIHASSHGLMGGVDTVAELAWQLGNDTLAMPACGALDGYQNPPRVHWIHPFVNVTHFTCDSTPCGPFDRYHTSFVGIRYLAVNCYLPPEPDIGCLRNLRLLFIGDSQTRTLVNELVLGPLQSASIIDGSIPCIKSINTNCIVDVAGLNATIEFMWYPKPGGRLRFKSRYDWVFFNQGHYLAGKDWLSFVELERTYERLVENVIREADRTGVRHITWMTLHPFPQCPNVWNISERDGRQFDRLLLFDKVAERVLSRVGGGRVRTIDFTHHLWPLSELSEDQNHYFALSRLLHVPLLISHLCAHCTK